MPKSEDLPACYLFQSRQSVLKNLSLFVSLFTLLIFTITLHTIGPYPSIFLIPGVSLISFLCHLMVKRNKLQTAAPLFLFALFGLTILMCAFYWNTIHYSYFILVQSASQLALLITAGLLTNRKTLLFFSAASLVYLITAALLSGNPGVIHRIPLIIFLVLGATLLVYSFLSNQNWLQNKLNEYIGELKQAKSEAQAANQEKSDWMAFIAHDMRSPLQAILGYTQLIQMQENTPSLLRDYLQSIQTSSEQLLVLSNQLLEYNRLGKERAPYSFTHQPFNEFLEEITREITPKLAEHHIKLHTSFPPEIISVSFDYQHLKRVFNNLFANALKFSTQGGKIFLEAKIEEQEVHISLRDEGEGIPPDEHEKIFDKFYQSFTLTARKDGFGLGLAICKKIIEEHQGKIWASNHEKKGAIFHLTLPLSTDL